MSFVTPPKKPVFKKKQAKKVKKIMKKPSVTPNMNMLKNLRGM